MSLLTQGHWKNRASKRETVYYCDLKTDTLTYIHMQISSWESFKMFKALSTQREHELCSLERLTEALSPHSSELLKLAGWKCEDVGRPREEERESEVQCERLGVVMWGEVRCAHSAREMKGVKHSFMKTRARYYCILSLSHQNRFPEHIDTWAHM